MARPTRKRIDQRVPTDVTTADTRSDVAASQNVVAEQDSLLTLSESLEQFYPHLGQLADREAQERERREAERADLDGKKYAIDVQTEMERNLDTWLNSDDPETEIRAYAQEALAKISDPRMKRAAAPGILSATDSALSTLNKKVIEDEQRYRQNAVKTIAFDRLREGAFGSVGEDGTFQPNLQAFNDYLNYTTEQLGNKRRAGAMLVESLTQWARQQGQPELISSEVMRSLKIDSQPLETVYKDTLMQARAAAQRKKEQQDALQAEGAFWGVMTTLQDKMAEGTITEKDFEWARQQGVSESRLLTMRGQWLDAQEEQNSLHERTMLFMNTDDVANVNRLRALPNDEYQEAFQNYAVMMRERFGDDVNGFMNAVIQKSMEVGKGYFYEPWKRRLEAATPGSAGFASDAMLYQKIKSMNPEYAEEMLNDSQSLMFDTYWTLQSQGNLNNQEALEVIKSQATPDAIREAKQKLAPKHGSQLRMAINDVMTGGFNADKNPRYVEEEMLRLAATRYSMGHVTEEKAVEWAKERFEANNSKFNGRWVWHGGLKVPEGAEEAFDWYVEEVVPSRLEGIGRNPEDAENVFMVPDDLTMIDNKHGTWGLYDQYGVPITDPTGQHIRVSPRKLVETYRMEQAPSREETERKRKKEARRRATQRQSAPGFSNTIPNFDFPDQEDSDREEPNQGVINPFSNTAP